MNNESPKWKPAPVEEAQTLYDVAHARAGNKEDICNISVIPYDETAYDDLVKQVTVDKVKAHFGGIVKGDIERYCVPSVSSMNFVLHGALDGGWTQSNRVDPSGKTLSQYMLRLPLNDDTDR